MITSNQLFSKLEDVADQVCGKGRTFVVTFAYAIRNL